MTVARPAMAFLPPPSGGGPGDYVVQTTTASRVTLVGDQEEETLNTPLDLYKHAMDQAWPMLIKSVEGKELTPKGEWVLIISPPEVDYHDLVSPGIAAQIDTKLAGDPSLRILYTAGIADSAEIEGVYPLEMLN